MAVIFIGYNNNNYIKLMIMPNEIKPQKMYKYSWETNAKALHTLPSLIRGILNQKDSCGQYIAKKIINFLKKY